MYTQSWTPIHIHCTHLNSIYCRESLLWKALEDPEHRSGSTQAFNANTHTFGVCITIAIHPLESGRIQWVDVNLLHAQILRNQSHTHPYTHKACIASDPGTPLVSNVAMIHYSLSTYIFVYITVLRAIKISIFDDFQSSSSTCSKY